MDYTLNHRNTNYTKYGWTKETHFKGFENLNEDTWEFGYGCSGVALAKPHREGADHVSIHYFKMCTNAAGLQRSVLLIIIALLKQDD